VNFHSTDPCTLAAFRRWLERKYGTVRNLKRPRSGFTPPSTRWLDNLDAPYAKWSSLRPLLDFEDFRADSIAAFVREWAGIIREVDPDHLVIADNSWSMTTFATTILGNDDWRIAACVDVFGLSVYPQSWDVRLRRNPAAVSQVYRGGVSAGRSAGSVPVMVSELQTHNQTALAHDTSVFDEIRLWTWQAFAHGIEGLVYWKWNPFTSGFQVASRGMTALDGTPNYRAAQAKEVAAVLDEYGEYFLGRVVEDNGVGLVYSAPCDRFTDLVLPDEPGFYRDCFAGWYRYLWRRGVTPLVVRPEDLSAESTVHLQCLVIPALVMLSPEEARMLERFVERDGRIVVDCRFAVVDGNGFAFERSPGNLEYVFGYVECDYVSPYADPAWSPRERFSIVRPAPGAA